MGKISLVLTLVFIPILLYGESSPEVLIEDNGSESSSSIPSSTPVHSTDERSRYSSSTYYYDKEPTASPPHIIHFLSELTKRHYPVRSVLQSFIDSRLQSSDSLDQLNKKDQQSIDEKKENKPPSKTSKSTWENTVPFHNLFDYIHDLLEPWITSSIPSSLSSMRREALVNTTELFPSSLLYNTLHHPDSAGVGLIFLSNWRLWLDNEDLPLQYLRQLPLFNLTVPSSVYRTHHLTETINNARNDGNRGKEEEEDDPSVTVPIIFRTVDDALTNLVLGTKLLHHQLHREEQQILERHRLQQEKVRQDSIDRIDPDEYIQTSSSLTLSSPTKESLQIIRTLLREYILEVFNGVLEQSESITMDATMNTSPFMNHQIMVVDFQEIFTILNSVGGMTWKDMHVSLDNFLFLLQRMIAALDLTSEGIISLLQLDTLDPDQILQDSYPPWSLLINPTDLSVALVDRYANIHYLHSRGEEISASDIWGDQDEQVFRKEWSEATDQMQSFTNVFDFIHEHHPFVPVTENEITEETIRSKRSNNKSVSPSLYYEFSADKDIVKPQGYVGSVYSKSGKIRYLREEFVHPLSSLWSMVYEDSLLTLSLLHLGRIQYQNYTSLYLTKQSDTIDTPPTDVHSLWSNGMESLESITAYLMREAYVPRRKIYQNYWNISLSYRTDPNVPESLPQDPRIVVDIPRTASIPRNLFFNDIEAYEILSMLSVRGIEPARIVLGYRMFHGWNTFPVIPQDEESRCTVALELVMSVANVAVNDVNTVSRLIQDTEVVPLWEAHEDNHVQSLVSTNEVNVEFIRTQADLGDVEAATTMGELLVHGHPTIGLRQDMNAAIDYLQYAVQNNGPPRAGTTLAILMLDGMDAKDPRRNLTEAMIILRKAAEEGNDDALSSLGYVYLTGNVPGEPQNVTLALEYLSRSAELGNINAHSNLAGLYLGSGGNDDVPFNGTKARYHLEAAAAAGFTPAVYNLGLLELHGWDHPQNIGNCSAAFPHMLKVAYIGRMMEEYPWLLTSSFSLHMKQAQRYASEKNGNETTPTIEPVAISSEQSLLHALVLSVLGMEQAFDNAGFLLESQDYILQSVEGFFLPRINLWKTTVDTWYQEDSYVQNVWNNENPSIINRILATADDTTVYRYDNEEIMTHSPLLTLDSHFTGSGSVSSFATEDSILVPHNVSFTVRPKFAAYRYYRQSTNSTHALFRRAMCFAEEWDGVLPCSPIQQTTDASFNRTEYVLSLLHTCMEEEDSHCTYTLANGYASGRIGRINVPINISQAWILLDHCLLYDPIHSVPILTSKLWLLWNWIKKSIVYNWYTYTGKEITMDPSTVGSYSLRSFWGSLTDCLWEDVDTNMTIPTLLKHPQKFNVLVEYMDEDGIIDEADEQRISNYIKLLYLQAFGPKYFLGPFPVSVSDRHICTLIMRTTVSILFIGLIFSVSLGFIYCSKPYVPSVHHPHPPTVPLQPVSANITGVNERSNEPEANPILEYADPNDAANGNTDEDNIEQEPNANEAKED